ncbi:hypothetical protein GTP46_18685 [Duganella sp. FT135W]|uniref:DUF4426 domain-containing protein n=1 Tax=Duganella flavida TaxID=2692175 RepID=A0A6L8KDD7_9BURK|nr:hypothetical protein [Duganella flavida]MYM24667.1 hypothetical protein [Duganella flavida]
MKLKLFILGALVLCTSIAANAANSDDVSISAVANRFVDALQHQRYRDAAAMFVPRGREDITTTEHALQRIDDGVGSFSTLHLVAALPDGRSVKLEVAAYQNAPLDAQKFVQLRYVSTASDGQQVFYELNLTADGMPPQILSFGLHLPTADTQSSKRANQLVNTIKH